MFSSNFYLVFNITREQQCILEMMIKDKLQVWGMGKFKVWFGLLWYQLVLYFSSCGWVSPKVYPLSLIGTVTEIMTRVSFDLKKKTATNFINERKYLLRSPCGVVANVLDCDVSENNFKLQLCYYIHFWTNAFGKGMKPLIPQLWVK